MISRKAIIIEGVTNSGKTTTINLLRKEMPGVTLVKSSDYYQKSVLRMFGRTEVSDDEVQQVVRYNQQRMELLVDYVRQTTFDDFIMERLHSTDFVYQRTVFGTEPLWNYEKMEQILNEMGAVMAILTLNDKDLEERMESTLGRRSRRYGASFEIPAHLLDYENNRQKRDGYLEFFELSSIERKVLLSTSVLNEREVVERIMNFF